MNLRKIQTILGKSYDEIMKLKNKNKRLLELSEVKFIINNKKISDWLAIYNTHNNFFFEQPIEVNRKKGFVAGSDAGSDRADLFCNWYPSSTDSKLGVIFAEDLK